MKNSSIENKAIIICAGEATRWGKLSKHSKAFNRNRGRKITT